MNSKRRSRKQSGMFRNEQRDNVMLEEQHSTVYIAYLEQHIIASQSMRTLPELYIVF